MLLLSSLCVACAEGPLEDAPLDEHRTSVAAGTAIVCDSSHQVARMPMSDQPGQSTVCKDFPAIGWEAEPLFASATAPASVLDRYCRYTFVPAAGATTGDVSALVKSLPTAEIGVDCQAVTPQGQAITDTIGQELDEFFGYVAGRVDGTGLDDAYPYAVRSAVQTTVIDTYPNAEPSKPISSHGPFVMSIIERIACPQGMAGCDIEVGAALGLPRTELGMNPDHRGGVVGLQSDLAHGIFEALERYRASPNGHSVMNLSVGWESELFGGSSPANMPPSVRAVYDVLRMARCEGSLIIASAGNSSGLTCNEEPLAPGRWEELPAPTGAECSSMGATAFVPDSASYTPLVHAVGGMAGAKSRMLSSREFGMPRLVAAASHAVARPRHGLPDLTIRTGTSVSAAVASAAASLVWSYAPDLSASDVMDVLYTSGVSSSVLSDFGVGAAVGIHRIDTCRAVKHACTLPGSDCGKLGVTLKCQTSAPVSLPNMVAAIEDLPPSIFEIRDANYGTVVAGCDDGCGGAIVFHPYDGEVRSCEATQSDPWAWLTSPQPPKSGCNDCVLTGTNVDPTALLTVDSAFAGDALVSVDIVVLDVNDMKHIYSLQDFDTGAVPALQSTRVVAYEVPFDLGGIEPRGATVVMTFASGIETEDPMLLK
ncbi:MAG: S8/S53 family peptidase [Nannocystaceae bacterium]|nr:S8/S53 family peptidase [Nannocystaceae bacterium]